MKKKMTEWNYILSITWINNNDIRKPFYQLDINDELGYSTFETLKIRKQINKKLNITFLLNHLRPENNTWNSKVMYLWSYSN